MKYTIRSDKLTAVIDSFGGELHSLKDTSGNESIWTAEDVWKRHAPLLFPFVCNTKSKKYTVNGKEYTKNYLTHRDLLNGATISYKMDAKPNRQRGTKESDFPYSFSNELKKKK